MLLVDYKREVLEILLNSEEVLIMLSAFIHFFPMLRVVLHACSKRSDGESAD